MEQRGSPDQSEETIVIPGSPGGMMLDARAVRDLLDYEGCIDAVRVAMEAFSSSHSSQPLRQIVELAPQKLFATMPGTLSGTDLFGAKLVSVCPDPALSGRSKHRGVVVLFGGANGGVKLIADAEPITEIRTACASAVATDALARKDARSLGLFGCGAQAEAHVRALRLVRPLERVLVWSRSHERAAGFAARMAGILDLDVRAVEHGEDAARADILCTVTSAATPILLGEWVRDGTHVNVVGSSFNGPREIDDELVARSCFYVDSRASVEAAGAEYIRARDAGLIAGDHIRGEIGDVLSGNAPGRRANSDVTIYKSLGHVVQDLAAARYLSERVRLAADICSPGGQG